MDLMPEKFCPNHCSKIDVESHMAHSHLELNDKILPK